MNQKMKKTVRIMLVVTLVLMAVFLSNAINYLFVHQQTWELEAVWVTYFSPEKMTRLGPRQREACRVLLNIL